MHSAFIIAAAAGMLGLASAASSQNTTLYYSVPISSVSTTDMGQWCAAQYNSCLDICDNFAFPNNCSTTDLSWDCTCSNFLTPNVSAYQQTVPYFLCMAYVAQCQVQNTNNRAAQQACLAIDCGPLNPVQALANYSSSAAAAAASTSAASTSSAMSTSASTTAASGSSTSASAAASSSAAAVALDWAQTYGSGVLGAGMLAAFGLAL